MADIDFTSLTDDELAALKESAEFEVHVRALMQPPRCITFKGLGPPWYSAPCRLSAGHEGDHDFGTVEEAKAAYASGMAAYDERQHAAQAEATRRVAL